MASEKVGKKVERFVRRMMDVLTLNKITMKGNRETGMGI